ncbi:SAM-dependent methyltransferase [Allosalinactinospora lopnorensis]|uniref:SAM-dependent methyltransferase n=1 Tax=Allosalinactinospora lopnorensis TaxID=1352348 RepID=UPI000623CC56
MGKGLSSTNGESFPPNIDFGVPSIARAYDAVLGGKDNFEADRAVARELFQVMPEIGDLAWDNRAILGRGVSYLAGEMGLRQFIDLGSGLPTVENTHQVAQRHNPTAQVVYVDNDPIVLAHGRALLDENEYTSVVTADLRDPSGVLGHPDVQRLIDFTRPVGILLVGMLHHLHDDEDPQGIVQAYLDACPSGSHLLVTHFCRSSPDAAALEETFLEFLKTGRFRTREEIERYFEGLELVEPGVVYLPEWRPDEEPAYPLTVGQRLMVGGIGRKP